MLTQTFTLFGGKEPQVFFFILLERDTQLIIITNYNQAYLKGINYDDVNAAIGECTLDKLNTIEYSNNIRLYIVYSDGSELGPSPGRLGIEFLGKARTRLRLNFLRMAQKKGASRVQKLKASQGLGSVRAFPKLKFFGFYPSL